ncbi:hypothetical protein [Roseateles sp. BYS87W]|uniref:PXPV repeat-containing protein n=1 Tax=Pelomonas baiyunensis TaxID=3299026 RepID=A0ABW7GY92_9BURK
MFRHALVTLATGTALLGAAAAQAGTHWSIGISLPATGVYVTDAPRYMAPPPVYYAPPPVVYAPAPRYVEREVVYVAPPPVIYERPHHHRHHHHWREERAERDDWRWRERREYDARDTRPGGYVEGPYRGR